MIIVDLIKKYECIDKNKTVIDFFKSMDLYDENYFNYINKRSKIFNLPYSEIKDFVGCYPIVKNNKIIGFNIVLPKLNTIFDVLIYIHEYSHALDIEDECEIFPNLMEAIFLVEYLKDDDLIKQQIKNIRIELSDNQSEKHRIGKKLKLNKLKSEICLNYTLK